MDFPKFAKAGPIIGGPAAAVVVVVVVSLNIGQNLDATKRLAKVKSCEN